MDRNEELSTADLAGQSAGSEVADGEGVRGEPADQTGEPRDAFPADRTTEGDYGDDRADLADDRAGGLGSRGFSGRTPADGVASADDDTTLAGDRSGDATRVDDGAMTGDRGGYADDRGFGGGVGGAGVDATGARFGDQTVGAREPSVTGTGTAAATGVTGGGGTGEARPLLPSGETEGFRARWTDVQTGFVDAPRKSVEQADALVAELMQHLAKTFADERSQLEHQWDRGEDIATDELRTAFQRYRSFFERLLST